MTILYITNFLSDVSIEDIKEVEETSYIDYGVLNSFLESFFISRIGLRAIMGNYNSLCSFLK